MMINKSNASFTPSANETKGQLVARLIAKANGGLNSAISFNNEIVEVVNDMQLDINAMQETLFKIRTHIETLDADSMGRDAEHGWSYRDEMIFHINKALNR